jgi:manganese oxidase
MRGLQLSHLSERLTGTLSRRALVRGGAGSVSLAAIGVAATNQDGESVTALAQVSPEPRTHDLVLTASEFDWTLMPDIDVRVWGYNGQVPGPELRVREGDTVRITLRNSLPVPTTIHWHGINVPNAMDGVAGLNQAPVEPGEEFVYEFVATPAGTRWYHSHTDAALQVPMGLYGAIIVEPREPITSYDREYTLILTEWDTELTPGVASGTEERGPGDRMLRGGELGADLFLVNGRMHGAIPPLRIAKDERILVRLIHAGAIPHPIHVHGHSFRIVATDGHPVPPAAQLTKDTVLIGPSERYDLEIVGDNPGVWMVHCHIEHHMANGMMTTLWYDGYKPTGPVADIENLHATGDDPPVHDHADATPAIDPAPTSPAVSPNANTVEITMVDDRFQPREVTVPAGTTVTWVSKGRDWHSVESDALGFSSGKVTPGNSFSFNFDQPGEFLYYCRHHAMAGMSGKVFVT